MLKQDFNYHFFKNIFKLVLFTTKGNSAAERV